LKIIGYSMTISLFLNLWLHNILAHSRVTVECMVGVQTNQQPTLLYSQHTAESSWIGPRNWSLYMAYCITNRWAWICSPQMGILWCNMLMLQMETSFTTIVVCLLQEFHSRTCTELSLCWIPYYTPQWSKKHHSPSNEWCLSQCWIGTNPVTHHQWEATPQHCQHRRWSTCWHQGTGVLWEW